MGENRFDIKKTTEKLIKGGVLPAASGIKMYTPDGASRYPAHWTRDFSYMVEDAGELIPLGHIKEGIQYIIDGARGEDGWIPDKVDRQGVAWYTAGQWDVDFALPNLDNGCFLCFLADEYLKRIGEKERDEQFLAWRDALMKGIDCLPTSESGMIENSAQPPHSPYGFTDTIMKTGQLCMETLLLWRAKKILIEWNEKTGFNADKYKQDCDLIERDFLKVFLTKDGTFRAATGYCNQTDVWAMCYAVSIGFPLPDEIKTGLSGWLVENYDAITESGQLRHLAPGDYWEKTFVPVREDTYQNGAFWATPVKWLCDALRLTSPQLATKTLSDVLAYFEKHGIYECVNGERKQLDTYVASATAVYGACKKDESFKDLVM